MDNAETQTAVDDNRPKWFSSPVTFHEGSLDEVRSFIPEFRRQGFCLEQPEGNHACYNERLDTIVRLPHQGDSNFIPVGVVSKDYTLVPHIEVYDIAINALEAANINIEHVKAEIEITAYGERMRLSFYLPKDYSIDPGDGHRMALRLECLNSVDGSTRFRALMGWFRFVCSNGLVVGITCHDLQRRHVGESPLEEVAAILNKGLVESDTEKENFIGWRRVSTTPEKLIPWINDDLKKGWGFKAAARAYHIVCRGFDAEIKGTYKDNTPTTISMRKTKRVPGTRGRCENLFDLSQILAWIAKERRDIHERIEWRQKIPNLIAPLMN